MRWWRCTVRCRLNAYATIFWHLYAEWLKHGINFPLRLLHQQLLSQTRWARSAIASTMVASCWALSSLYRLELNYFIFSISLHLNKLVNLPFQHYFRSWISSRINLMEILEDDVHKKIHRCHSFVDDAAVHIMLSHDYCCCKLSSKKTTTMSLADGGGENHHVTV